jgi:DNA-binding MarR family transcriptional regulator
MVEPSISQAAYERAASDVLGQLETPIDIDSFHAVWLLHQAAASAREHQVREALDPLDLTWTQFEVLWNVWIFGERDAGWVARAALVSKSGLTSILTQLERRRLIERRPDAADGRKSLVTLSDEGQRLMVQLIATLNESDRAFTEPLTPSGKRQLVDLLNTLLTERPGHNP